MLVQSTPTLPFFSRSNGNFEKIPPVSRFDSSRDEGINDRLAKSGGILISLKNIIPIRTMENTRCSYINLRFRDSEGSINEPNEFWHDEGKKSVTYEREKSPRHGEHAVWKN